MKKTGRVNKTDKQLQLVWEQLDNASGELYNAFENISHMVDVPKEILLTMEKIDVSTIDQLRNEIEKYLDEKRE